MVLMGVLCVCVDFASAQSMKEISSRPQRAGSFTICSFSEHVHNEEMKGRHKFTKEMS